MVHLGLCDVYHQRCCGREWIGIGQLVNHRFSAHVSSRPTAREYRTAPDVLPFLDDPHIGFRDGDFRPDRPPELPAASSVRSRCQDHCGRAGVSGLAVFYLLGHSELTGPFRDEGSIKNRLGSVFRLRQ